ncbi:zinc finger, CCHC-type containing protein [Tanacetum coccineum]
MIYSRPVLEQYNELLGILRRFTQHKMNIDESIQVSCIIDKLLPSWKDFKHTLKHLKEELTLVELGSHLRIEESLRVQDSDKPKSNNVAGPQEVVRLLDPKLKTLGERGIGCIFVGYAEHFKAFRFYVIEPNDSVAINSIIESRDVIFDENRFSLVPRPSLSIPKGTEDISGSLVPKVVTDEDDQKHFGGIIWGKAMKSQDVAFWKEVINDEMNSIMGNNTWVLVDLPPGCKPLGCKWIFKRKLKVDGTIEKFKAKLVIQGFKQKSGIYYFDTYALVARISTIRLLIAMTSIHNLIIHQMDVNTAFLNGDLDEEVYINQPQGFIMPGNENKYSSMASNSEGIEVLKVKNMGLLILTYTGYLSVLEGYTDASCISNTEDNSSTSGWVFLLGGGAISWASKKQTCITGSTTESESVALAAADKEIEWLKNLHLEILLWSKPIAPISIRYDSASTLAKAYSQMYNGKSRHLGVSKNLADTDERELARDLVIKSAEGMGLKYSNGLKGNGSGYGTGGVDEVQWVTVNGIIHQWSLGDPQCVLSSAVNLEEEDALLALQHECGVCDDGGDNPTVEQVKKRAKMLNLPKNYNIPWRLNIWLRMHQEELTLVKLGSHLCIDESLRVQDSDKPKGNNIAGPLVVNMVEHNNSSMYNDKKGKRKRHDNTRANPNKKAKLTCCKCGKISHIKRDCKSVNVDNKANGSGTKGSMDGSSNSLKGEIDLVVVNDRMLNIVNDNIGSAFMSTSKLNDSILWHARLGHVHFKRMQDMSKDGLIPAFDLDTEKCKTCMLTKITKKPFQNVKCETEVLELIRSDLCDLHATLSLGNKKYFVTFIDDALRFCYVYFLHNKDEALDKFKVFKTKVELQQESLIKRFKTDRGGEYMDTLYFQSVGIIHETTAPYTPQQNDIYERKNRVPKEMVNFMLTYSGLSQGFWGLVVVRLPNPKLKTLGERGIECIFVRHVEQSKAFRLYVIEPNDSVLINSIIKSRDAIFDEDRLSLVPRPSLRIPNGTEDIGGSVVPEEITEEVVQQPKPKLRKSKWNRTPKNFRPEFQLYLIEGTRDEDLAFWKEAINNEMDSIMGNNTWVLADLPPGCKPLGCKWIFKKQLKVDGTIEKFKAKLVFHGFRQKSGMDYFDTYALVARISTIRLLIAMASFHNLIIHQMDVKTAFLNGELDEDQAPKQCYQKFDEVVLSNGYLLNQADKCGSDKRILSSRFSMKDTGEADVILVSTPMDTCEKLMPNNGQAVSQLEYSRVIGCLMYSMIFTRPDIAFAVGKLSRLTYTGYPLVLRGYIDTSWISNTEDNSSTSKYEFIALTVAGKEAEWLKNLLLEIPLWSKPIAPIYIQCDSAATLSKAYSQMSQQNLADHLTKGLARDLVIKSAEGMGLKMCLEPADKEDEVVNFLMVNFFEKVLNGGDDATMEQIRKMAKWDNDDYAYRCLILNGNHTLKHLKEELTLVELGSHLCIEESLKVQDSDKPKGNNVVGPLVVNMVEHNNSTRDCKGVNVGNKANGLGTKAPVDGSSNSLKSQNMFNKSLQVYYVTYVSEAYFVQDDDVAWWVNSGATVHVCKDRSWFKTYKSLNDGSILHMGNESTALVLGRGCVDLRFSSEKIVSFFNVKACS